MAEHSGINERAAVMVESKTAGKPIMVERDMYWNNRGGRARTPSGVTRTKNLPGIANHLQTNSLLSGDIGYAGTKQGVWKYDGTSWTNTGGAVSSYSAGPVPPPPPPPNFNTYIVLQNPNAKTANVTLTYMMEGGETKQESVTVGPTTRKTLYLNDSVGTGKSFSTSVSSSIPIIAERPMYFNYKGTWTGGHDVVGALAPDTTWYFAEGYTGW